MPASSSSACTVCSLAPRTSRQALARRAAAHRGGGAAAPQSRAPPAPRAHRRLQAHGRLRLVLAKKIDRQGIDELFGLGFLDDGVNAILVGPNGVGKTMILRNLAHHALVQGHTVRFTTASDMLADLAAQECSAALARRLRRYTLPRLLCIDEVGYLSYDNRYADLLFEVVTRRYDPHKSIVLSTNKAFAEWSEVFPHAACVVTLVDRLVHRSEIIEIEGDSYRLKEAKERAALKTASRRGKKSAP